MPDPRQPSDCVIYDADGNIIRVIVARKRANKRENELNRLRGLHKIRESKKAKKNS